MWGGNQHMWGGNQHKWGSSETSEITVYQVETPRTILVQELEFHESADSDSKVLIRVDSKPLDDD